MAFTRVRVVNLSDLTNRAHADLSDSPTDAHHDGSHTVASHSDTTASGSNLTDLVGSATQPGGTAVMFAMVTLFS